MWEHPETLSQFLFGRETVYELIGWHIAVTISFLSGLLIGHFWGISKAERAAYRKVLKDAQSDYDTEQRSNSK